MAEKEPERPDHTDELDGEEIDGQNAEELPDREVMSVIAPMNPQARVGGEVIQPPPGDT
jgi:hypothetical protein